MHLLANPPPEPAPGASPGTAAASEDEEREVVPLAREVVAQVVDALFDRWAGLGLDAWAEASMTWMQGWPCC